MTTIERPFRLMDTRLLAVRLRKHVLRMTNRAKSAHIGSAFSMADIIAVLYGHILRIDPARPAWPLRDRFILSKGHAGACVYAALAECGFFEARLLETYYMNGSVLSGHISHKGVAGVELSTGSLGHGLGIATGMALAGKKAGAKHRVFAVLSDGECDEGSNWEAFLFAAHHLLENLVVAVDYNKIQSLAPVSETIGLEPFAEKLRMFNWSVVEIDGHDHDGLARVFKALPAESGKPTFVLAHTVKGRGVSFMEHSVLWHYRSPQGEEFNAALAELDRAETLLIEHTEVANARRIHSGPVGAC